MARLADPELAERRRRQILEAALHCFRRRGFHQATMQEICSEAGISPGALYRYFSSKADIIAAIAEDERRETESVLAAVRASGGLIDALCDIFNSAIGRFAREAETPIFADVFAEAARDPILARKLAEIDSNSVRRLADALRAAQSHGEIDSSLDPETAARTLIAAIEGIGLRYALGRRKGGDDTDISDFRALAERYLGSPS